MFEDSVDEAVVPLMDFTSHSVYLRPGGGGGGYLGQFLLGMCRWPLETPTPLKSILWPSYRPHLSHF